MQRLSDVIDHLVLTASFGDLTNQRTWHQLHDALETARQQLSQNLHGNGSAPVTQAVETADDLLVKLADEPRQDAIPDVRQRILHLNRLVDRIFDQAA